MPSLSYVERLQQCSFSHFLAPYFPNEKIQKITLSAGTTCPNREGRGGQGGCTYCNNRSFSPAYALGRQSITQQLEEGISFFKRKYPTMRYLAYFQAYTATYGDVERLISLYEEALQYPNVVGLIIGTRPDCMPQPLLDYFAQRARTTFVLIEYGVESTCNTTLQEIQRGHTWECSVEAIEKTHAAGIPVGAHLILGLPHESREMLLQHANRLSRLPIQILKLHQLQIVRHTLMAKEYAQNPQDFRFFTPQEYIELCLDFLSCLREDIIVERFVSQCPPELLIAPEWHIKNYAFADRLRKAAQERDLGRTL